MSVTITGEERDALYNRIVVRLNGIDDVYRAAEAGDWETAQALGQEFSDLLRLVCTDLGWGDKGDESLCLVTPPDVLARAARVLRELASWEGSQYESESRELEEKLGEARRLAQTCERILGQLEQAG